ncbi:MAG: type II toxin-antitoxin system VapC family toxin, partial [Microbacterium sp.]
LGIEVASALRGLVLSGQMDPERGSQAIADLMAIDVALHDTTVLLPRVWALRENLSAYDAGYVALAEVLGATLVTGDARIARSPGIRAEIHLIAAG